MTEHLTYPTLDQIPQRIATFTASAIGSSDPGPLSADEVTRLLGHPYIPRDATTIPPRQWLMGRTYLRGCVSALVAPGGTGKSMLCLPEAIAMASNHPLIGDRLPAGKPLNVWYWNGEDPREEIDRRIEAICLHHGIRSEGRPGRLIISDITSDAITIASKTSKDGVELHEGVVSRIRETIRTYQIDVVIFDPFISIHRVTENDTGAIDMVTKALAKIAIELNCAIGLCHHVRKPPNNGGSGEVTMADSRGAIAMIDATRIGRTLNPMSEDEANKCGVPVDERRRYIRIDDGKANFWPRADKARWVYMASVDLGNATEERPSDRVGVPEPWEMPGLFDDVRAAHLEEVVARVWRAENAGRPYRKDAQTANWIGVEVADVLGLDLAAPGVKAKINKIVARWIENKALRVARHQCERRQMRPCVFVGPGEGRADDGGV